MTNSCFPKQSQLVNVEQALTTLLSYANPSEKTQLIAIEQSLGFVLAQDVISDINIPPKDNSSMDGYALNSADFLGEPLKVSARISAGETSQMLKKNTAVRIFTGAQIPQGADSVIMQEECEQNQDSVEIFSLPVCGQNIRRQGEDIKQGDKILNKGYKIRPQDIGLLASVGVVNVSVYNKITVAILSTGNEIKNPGTSLKTGQIYNSNRYTLLGLLADMAVEVMDLGIIADDFTTTKNTLIEAANTADIIISTGGVSVGEEDHIKTALEEVGQLMMWRIRMKPGKPLAFGKIGKAFFMGLPGNPVSTFAVFNLFVRPFVAKFIGNTAYVQQQFLLTADFDWLQKGERREYLRASVKNNKVVIYPNQGSGVLSSTTWASGFCCIMENTCIKKGDLVAFIPFSQWGRV